MTGSSSMEIPVEDIEKAAADWFARRRSGQMTLTQARELEVWLAGDPERRGALAAVEAMWEMSQAIRSDPVVLALREESLRRRRPPLRLVLGGSIAAGLAVCVAAGLLLAGPARDPISGPRTFRTTGGQTSTITLPDGSKVTLDANTVLRADETAHLRRLELVRGRAFFRVAKDPSRPFVVTARDKTVTALGTVFDVRLQRDGVEVTLVEGKVKVEAPVAPAALGLPRRKQSTELNPGSQLTAPDSGSWTMARVDTTRESSWAAGQLVFAGKSLAEVARDLNRYSDRKIVIADPSVGRATISGSFDAGDVDGFVRAVESYRLARVRSATDEVVELGAP